VPTTEGSPWRPVTDNKWKCVRQALERQAIPLKVSVTPKGCEMQVHGSDTGIRESGGHSHVPFWNVLQGPDVDFSTGSKNSKEYGAETAPALEDRTRSDFGPPEDFQQIIDLGRVAVV